MQLDKIVAYHKALADPNRLRMLLLLSQGEMNGQELAARLNLSQPTVTHHAAKLREAALIQERREKNTVYFSLYPPFIREHAQATLDFIFQKGETRMDIQEVEVPIKASVLRNFFTKDGCLKQIPSQLKKKLIVMEYLAEQLEPGKAYPECEVNEFIKQYHEDFATIRRELIMHQFMYREKEVYELNPREMWAKWEQLK
ncbi:metalloregulator ArsR/SmtB family transcription factor [Paenibacillus sp. JX-17]|uniref:Metalloregulator ArsR/SmtB family transcription factor n=1 Tax=Paenibacillus lacisoli TaxID=3064525 RepID=A0ABT9CDQ5_9BACL|nr:metalloregulator ArsR/SmtB family transcription factor [Paenibacillus sp. JX-17]MDO7905728.1 metalloregulator ArsR/SmtB family transcription factor [Paenibacillus sp. JX-17]